MKVRSSRIEGSVLVTDWADKEVTRMDAGSLSPEIRDRLVIHGLSQKVMDAHSGVYAKTNSVAACRAATVEVWDALVGGTWNLGRESYGWLVRALADLGKMSEPDARATIDTWSDNEMKTFAGLKEVKTWKLDDDRKRLEAAPADKKNTLAAFLKKAK